MHAVEACESSENLSQVSHGSVMSVTVALNHDMSCVMGLTQIALT